MLRALERRLTFKPNSLDHGALAGLAYERLTLGNENGLALDGGFARRSSERVILFIHGNRHNITKFTDHYRLFEALGHSYLFFDYPGYGKSPGVPSESVFYESARAAYRYLRETLGYGPENIIVYGCSLGGAVSVELVSCEPAACLITESTFTCSWEMARHLYPKLPIWWLFPNRFRNDLRIPQLRIPLLMLHGQNDGVVPVTMGHRLFESAPSARTLLLIRGANHVNSLELGGAEVIDEIRAFIDGKLTGKKAPRTVG